MLSCFQVFLPCGLLLSRVLRLSHAALLSALLLDPLWHGAVVGGVPLTKPWLVDGSLSHRFIRNHSAHEPSRLGVGAGLLLLEFESNGSHVGVDGG